MSSTIADRRLRPRALLRLRAARGAAERARLAADPAKFEPFEATRTNGAAPDKHHALDDMLGERIVDESTGASKRVRRTRERRRRRTREDEP